MSETFMAIKAAMDHAKKDQNLGYFRDACLALGVQETDDGSVVSIRHSYKLAISDGMIQGTLRSYDQSGPFQNLPDMNKIEMVLKRGNEVQDRHYVEWED